MIMDRDEFLKACGDILEAYGRAAKMPGFVAATKDYIQVTPELFNMLVPEREEDGWVKAHKGKDHVHLEAYVKNIKFTTVI
jgi:hypothetical protein